MSKRRKLGDKVWLSKGAGFTGDSNRLMVEIPLELTKNELGPCGLCDDKKCVSYYDVLTDPDPKNFGIKYTLPHVSECQMFDEKQE